MHASAFASSLANSPACDTGNAVPAPTYDLLGVGMSILTLPEAVGRILSAVESGKKGYVCVTGMHGIMEARDDPKLQRILNSAFLCTPDGMPTVWLGKARGHSMERVYGPDLTLSLLEATAGKPVRHFFYGGAEGVAEDLKHRMQKRFPGLQVTGIYCPPFRPLNDAEKQSLRELVEKSGADILWVGLSTPKQERFMAEFLPQLPVKVMLGVGAAFDFHTGRAKQAPRWMMRAGLEWFFRLVTEPKRLWRRYLIQVPRFASLVGLDTVGLVSHSSEFPEMPRAFHLMSHWRTVLFASIGFWGGSTLGMLLLCGGAIALQCAGLALTPILAFPFYAMVAHCFAEEDRLDRAGPILSLAIAVFSGLAAIFCPIAIFVAGGLGYPYTSLHIAGYAAAVSLIPLVFLFVCFAVIFVGASAKWNRHRPKC